MWLVPVSLDTSTPCSASAHTASPPVWAPDPQREACMGLTSGPSCGLPLFLLWRCTVTFDVSFHCVILWTWQFSSRVPGGSPEQRPPRRPGAYQRASTLWAAALGCRRHAFPASVLFDLGPLTVGTADRRHLPRTRGCFEWHGELRVGAGWGVRRLSGTCLEQLLILPLQGPGEVGRGADFSIGHLLDTLVPSPLGPRGHSLAPAC